MTSEARHLLSLPSPEKQIPRFARDDNSENVAASATTG